MEQDLASKPGVQNPDRLLFCAKNSLTNSSVCGGADPLFEDQFRPHMANKLSHKFQNLAIKYLFHSLTRWDKLSERYPLAVTETNQHCLN
jgi:hypothetical protein